MTRRKVSDSEVNPKLLSKYVRILDSSPDMIAYLDKHRRYVFVNKKYREMNDFAEDEVVGRSIDEVFGDFLPASIIDRINAALAGEEQQFELKSPMKAGSERWIEASYVPDFDANNDVQGIFAYIRDIDQRKSLEQSRASFEYAVDQGVEGFALHDEAGNFTYINPAQAAFYGYRPEEVLGQSWSLFYDDEQVKEIENVHFPQLMKEGKWHGELIGQKKNGEKFNIEVSLTLLIDDEGNPAGLACNCSDITRRKVAENELRTARDQAVVANRAKTDMIANMNHELRTPLNAIIGFSSLMKDGVFGLVENDRYKNYIKDICDSSEHLMAVLNDILDVSAVEAGEIDLKEENLDIADIVEASVRLVHGRADMEKVSISTKTDPTLPRLLADSRRVKQVLINLLTNSIKFTPAGGSVTVTPREEENGSLAISVADTGIGMDDAEVEIALSRFGQVDSGLDRKIQEGTGLGLPLCLGFMELHGGTLEIKSEKGRGTEVIVTFPSERTV